MLRHESIWAAIDTLAARKGLSLSALARQAGLDPTSFNPSKRVIGGRAHWPSTESLAQLLQATGTTMEAFLAPLAQSFGGNFPRLDSEDSLALPPQPTSSLAALVCPDMRGMPVFESGSILIVRRDWPALPGTRVALRPKGTDFILGKLTARTHDTVTIAPFNEQQPKTFFLTQLDWIHPILWSTAHALA